jgi:antitoxin component of RelBE/YafQ-DinJ toxin-antitoxin module
MNMSTAIVVFAKTVVREHQFPFVISERPFGVGENRQSEVENDGL